MDSSTVFGFNYDGSWGTSGLDLWQHHDAGRMAVEIARGKAAFPAWNTCRWWLSHEAYQRDPQRFLANVESGLAILASHGIRAMPVLFNRWRDPFCDFGGAVALAEYDVKSIAELRRRGRLVGLRGWRVFATTATQHAETDKCQA